MEVLAQMSTATANEDSASDDLERDMSKFPRVRERVLHSYVGGSRALTTL
jgi:hypothetical protein